MNASVKIFISTVVAFVVGALLMAAIFTATNFTQDFLYTLSFSFYGADDANKDKQRVGLIMSCFVAFLGFLFSSYHFSNK